MQNIFCSWPFTHLNHTSGRYWLKSILNNQYVDRLGGVPTSPPLFLNQQIVHWSETCRAGVSVYHPSLPRGSATLNIAPPPIFPPCPFSNWEPLVHTGDPERPISPWAGRPRGSGSPCADSGSVNRADGFWQIHSDWKSFILQDFFFSLFHETPPYTKRAVHLPLDET